jgi:hypothetical protein
LALLHIAADLRDGHPVLAEPTNPLRKVFDMVDSPPYRLGS